MGEKWLRILPKVATKKSDPTGRISLKGYFWGFLENLFKEIQISIKSYKNNGYFT